MKSIQKKSILSWLMGLSMLVVAPAAMADKGDRNHGSHKYKQNHSHKHTQTRKHAKHTHKKVVKAHRHNNKHAVKHYKPVNNHRSHHHVDKHGWSFTISNHQPYYSDYRFKHKKRNKFAYHSKQIRKRQANQKRRIRKGINKGQLVRFEKRELRQQQRRIANRIADFSSDGRLNRHERNKINRMQDRASNNIRNKRHNQYTRYNSRHNHRDEYIAYYH